MENTDPLKRLWELIVVDSKEISSIYFYAIFSGLVQLSLPLGVQAIIGFVLGASMVTSIYVLIVVVVIGVLLVGIMQINQMKIIEKIQQSIFTRYAFEFTESIPNIDLKKADPYYLPEKVNRFFETLNLQKGLSKLLLDIPAASIQIFLGLILLAFYHPIFIVFDFLLLFILWIILRLTSKNGLITSRKESSYKYDVVAWMQEMARVIESFKLSQGGHLNLQNTDKNVTGYLKARTSHFKVLILQYRSLVFFKVAITTAMLGAGAYLLLNQQLNIGEFIAAEIVILTMISSVEKLISSLDSVYDVITGLEKLASVIEMPTEKDGTMPLVSTQGFEIDIEDFKFQYTDDSEIFHNISVHIPPNSKVCISGNEGSGKSTLLKIMSGNYHDFKGSLRVNSIPIGNYQLENLRNKIGLYLNERGLFKGTILENITMGHNGIALEEISGIAEKTGIKGFINKLQNGFETAINPAGKGLPDTTIKKILLLRAFANEPKLLLLDEPWQGLEDDTKHLMINYLIDKSENTTVIVASNDKYFAEKCDYHIELANGKATITKRKS